MLTVSAAEELGRTPSEVQVVDFDPDRSLVETTKLLVDKLDLKAAGRQVVELVHEPDRAEPGLSRAFDAFVDRFQFDLIRGRNLNADPNKLYLSSRWCGSRLVQVEIVVGKIVRLICLPPETK